MKKTTIKKNTSNKPTPAAVEESTVVDKTVEVPAGISERPIDPLNKPTPAVVEESAVVDKTVEELDTQSNKEDTLNDSAEIVDLLPSDPLASVKLSIALAVLSGDIARPISPKDIATAQVDMFHCIMRGITCGSENDTKVFLLGFLKYIVSNPDMFKSKKIFREFNNLKSLTGDDLRDFEMLLPLLRDTAAPESRRVNASSMNWDQVSARLTSKNSTLLLERLKDFYKI